MKVIRNISEFPKLDNVVVTNGTFDGCHIGHQKILSQLKESAKAINGKTVVLTYWPHPRIVLGKEDDNFKLLYTIEERIKILEEYEIDYLVILNFTKEFANQTSDEFINNIIIKGLNTSKLIIGYNHRFGKNREGGFDYLTQNKNKFPFEIEEISKQVIDDEGVSSTKIRQALQNGEIKTANSYLEKSFSLSGKVVFGMQLGRKLQYPTANIDIETNNKIIPKDGVYVVQVHIDNRIFGGMMNIGFKPTVDSKKQTIEVHIFNFDEYIYGKYIEIDFIERLRDEQKFNSIEELKNQLDLDKEKSLSILSKTK